MRFCIPLAIAALLAAAGCAGGSTTLPAGDQSALTQDTAQPADGGLAALPSPREVSVGNSVVDVNNGTRSFLVTTALYFTPTDGIRQEFPDLMLIFEPSTEQRMTHILFPLVNKLDNPGVTVGQISLDIDWHGDVPSGSDGFYVGVPDYEHDCWVWRGPARSSADILDFSGLGLGSNPAEFSFDKVCLVNMSSVEAKVKFFSFTTLNPGDVTGDEMLFFVTNDGGNYAIQSVYTANPDTATTILSADSGVELSNVNVVQAPGGPLLVFDRRAAGGNWEVWQSNLDGSAAQVRYSGVQNVRFSVATPDNSYEFTLEGSGPEYYSSLVRHMSNSAAADIVRAIPGSMKGSGTWYGNSNTDVSVVGTGVDEDGNRTAMLYTWSSFSGNDYFVPMAQMEEGASVDDAIYFNWYDGTSFSPKITLCSVAAPGDNTDEIRAYYTGLSTDTTDRVFMSDESYSLRYPSISPDRKLFSVVACAPGMDYGELYLQSSFLRELDHSAAVAPNVVGTPAWYDPTPPAID